MVNVFFPHKAKQIFTRAVLSECAWNDTSAAVAAAAVTATATAATTTIPVIQ